MSVTSINDAPVVVGDVANTNEDLSVLVDVLGNDNGGPANEPQGLTLSTVTNATNGTVAIENGKARFTPAANFNGAGASFQYSACDSGGLCSTGTVAVTVAPVNDPVVLANDALSVVEGGSNSLVVTSNDTTGPANESSQSLSVLETTVAARGNLLITSPGTITYTVKPGDDDYNGTDSFTYRACDNEGSCDWATVDVTITAVNDAPVPQDDAATTTEDSSGVVIDVLANDSAGPANESGQTKSIGTISGVDAGAAATAGANGITYVPAPNTVTAGQFTYQSCDNGTTNGNPDGRCTVASVTVTLTEVNDAPTLDDRAVTTAEESPLAINLLAGASKGPANESAQTLSATVLSGPAHGTFTNGTYTPADDYVGTDAITVKVCDDGTTNGAADPLCDDLTTITINVTAVNDLPVAADRTESTDEDQPLVVTNLLASVTQTGGAAESGETLSIKSVQAATNGSVALASGVATFTPAANYHGPASFTYTACDDQVPAGCGTALVSITVASINDAPIIADDSATVAEDSSANALAVLGNDRGGPADEAGDALAVTDVVSGPAHGTAGVNADGVLTYTPAADYFGSDSLRYLACDADGACATADVAITVSPRDDAPVAANDAASTTEDAQDATSIDVIANDDSGPGESDTLVITDIADKVGGSYQVVDGRIAFLPAANFNGDATATYRVCQANDATLCAAATVTIAVAPVNDAPVPAADVVTIDEDSNVDVNVVSNDSPGPNETGNLALDSASASNGTATVVDGKLRYVPNGDFNGTDVVSYKVCDDGTPSACSTAGTLTVTVRPVNDRPVADDDTGLVSEDHVAIVDVLDNDTPGGADDEQDQELNVGTATDGAHGTTEIMGTTVHYTPEPNFNGTDSFTYTVCDAIDSCDAASVSVTVSAVNDAPTADDDAYVLEEDALATVLDVGTGDLAGPADESDQAITVTAVTSATLGAVAIADNGDVVYTPGINEHGVDSFDYTVCDSGSLCDTGTVTVTLTSVNDAPDVRDDAKTLAEDAAATAIDVLSNDDAGPKETGAVTVAGIVSPPAKGAAEYTADGVTYTPAAHRNGSDSFTYRACDADGACSVATVAVSITAVNDAPIASADSASVDEDASVDVDVRANDAGGPLDEAGESVTVVAVGAPAHGSAGINEDGTVRYAPAADYNGSDTVSYTVRDADGVKDTSTLQVNVRELNDDVTAVADEATTSEDTSITVDPRGNDAKGPANESAQQLAVTAIVGVSGGTATVANDGAGVSFVPTSDLVGDATVDYRVCDDGTSRGSADAKCDEARISISITAVNDRPVANGDAGTAAEDGSVLVDVLANDTPGGGADEVGQPLTIGATTSPEHGGIVKQAGRIRYTPAPDYNGDDSFSYSVCDETDSCTTGTVELTVTAVNDAPVAADDTATIGEDAANQVIDVLGNDQTGPANESSQQLQVTEVTGAARGTVSIDDDGQVVYDVAADEHGTDSFDYTVCDDATPSECDSATVTLTITAVNDAPRVRPDAVTVDEDADTTTITVLGNDDGGALEDDQITVTAITAPPGFGTAAFTATGVTYTPAANRNGTDTFTYRACDDQTPALCDTALVTVTVTAKNDAPDAVADAVDGDEDTAIDIDVRGNDAGGPFDEDAEAVTLTSVGEAQAGTTSVVDGKVHYVPAANANGLDTFSYTIEDAAGLEDTTTVQVNVREANDAITANGDTATTAEDTALEVDPRGNDVTGPANESGQQLTVTSIIGSAGGSASVTADGTGISFAPTPDLVGPASVTYRVCDDGMTRGQLAASCANASISITITPVNDAPVAAGDARRVDEDGSVVIDVLANDAPGGGADEAGQTLSIGATTAATNGNVAVENGSIRYTPAPNYNGGDSFTYSACDAVASCATATVTLMVDEINDRPNASADTFEVTEDAAATIVGGVLANDNAGPANESTQTLRVTAATDGAKGTTTVQSGVLRYAPNENAVAGDSFTYTVCDDGTDRGEAASRCHTATVSVTITPTNDAPVPAADAFQVAEDASSRTLAVADNDAKGPADENGQTLRVTKAEGASHGTVSLVDGVVSYTPEANYVGADAITYEVCDDGTPNACAIGSAAITVTPVNDEPVPVDDLATGIEDDAANITVDVVANDSAGPADESGQQLSLDQVTIDSSLGTAQVQDGKVVVDPAADVFGTVTVGYVVCDDGTTAGDAAPKCANGTLQVSVEAVNDAPTANADSATLAEDTPAAVVVLANDSKGPANESTQQLRVAAVSNADNGTVALDAGTVTFSPAANFNGEAHFDYQVCDNGTTSLCANGHATIAVTAVNDAPTFAPAAITTSEDTAKTTVKLLDAATAGPADESAQNLTVHAGSLSANHGAAAIAAGGTEITFTPDNDYNGPATVQLKVCDDGSPVECSVIRSLAVTVTPVNDAPRASDGTFDGREGTSTAIALGPLVSDPETATNDLSYEIVSGPASGSLSGTGSTRSYTPNVDFDGTDSFTYRVLDGGDPTGCSATPCTASLASTVQTVTIRVAPEAPTTTILAAPAGNVTATTADITFRSNKANATFECSLDGAGFGSCASPLRLEGLAVGAHTLDVRARDAAGTVDASPATATWTIQAPPVPPSDVPSGPAADVTAPGVSFTRALTATSAQLRTRGLGIALRTNEQARVVGTLTISAATARTLGISARGPVTIGTATRSVNGSTTLQVRLNATGLRVLARRGTRRITVSVALVATDGAGNVGRASRSFVVSR